MIFFNLSLADSKTDSVYTSRCFPCFRYIVACLDMVCGKVFSKLNEERNKFSFQDLNTTYFLSVVSSIVHEVVLMERGLVIFFDKLCEFIWLAFLFEVILKEKSSVVTPYIGKQGKRNCENFSLRKFIWVIRSLIFEIFRLVLFLWDVFIWVFIWEPRQ